MQNRITINIDGIDATCLLIGNDFYAKVLEYVSGPQLLSVFSDKSPSNLLKIMPGIFYAGYVAECNQKRVQPRLKLRDFRFHFYSLDPLEENGPLAQFMKIYQS